MTKVCYFSSTVLVLIEINSELNAPDYIIT